MATIFTNKTLCRVALAAGVIAMPLFSAQAGEKWDNFKGGMKNNSGHYTYYWPSEEYYSRQHVDRFYWPQMSRSPQYGPYDRWSQHARLGEDERDRRMHEKNKPAAKGPSKGIKY